MATNWSIVSIWDSMAGWIMGCGNKGYILRSTASAPCTVCGAAIGLVSKLNPGEKLLGRYGKSG
jgi:hypothetical protein